MEQYANVERNDRQFLRMSNIDQKTYRLYWFCSAILFVLGVIHILFYSAVFVNHLSHPDINRGNAFESCHRMVASLPLYPSPSIEFIGLVHNPLFSVLGAGGFLLFGEDGKILKAISVTSILVCLFLVYHAVSRASSSRVLGILSAGLFLSGYHATDGYMDYAHPDALMLVCAVGGLSLVAEAKRDITRMTGFVLLCAGFWAKQHGAVFVLGALVFHAFDRGFRKTIPYAGMVLLLGPVLYLFVGPQIFGPHFFSYTYDIPSHWAEISLRTLGRPILHFARFWPFCALISLLFLLRRHSISRATSVWMWTLPFALLSAFVGAMDAASDNNIFLAADCWLAICGPLALFNLVLRSKEIACPTTGNIGHERSLRCATFFAIIVISFGLNYVSPGDIWVKDRSKEDYHLLISKLDSLDGDVWLPSIGQLPDTRRLRLTAHYVQLQDLVRRPHYYGTNSPVIEGILHEVAYPVRRTYILTEDELEHDDVLGFLATHYSLVSDFGDTFKSLKAIPGRYSGHTWVRYLYVSKSNS